MSVNDSLEGWELILIMAGAANYEIIPEKAKVIKELKTAAKSVDSIYLATDLDREGEAIAWHLQEALRSRQI